ncbi:MAG: hypothetical protein WCS71_00055 [Sphaerochaetaceae bacterium]
MRRFVWICLCSLGLCFPLAAVTPWVAVDSMAIDALWSGQLTLRAETGVRLDDGFGIRFPVSWVRRLGAYDVSMLTAGLSLDYYPFGDGLVVSFGVVEGGWFLGKDRPEEEGCLLNGLDVGYTWHVTPHWFIEPKLQVRDPSGVFSTEYGVLEDALGDYPVVRLSVLVGWEFLASASPSEPRRE